MNITNSDVNFNDEVDIDRISRLPNDVIDLIMKFIPTWDAARTCVLSSNWRYIWTNHLFLILDQNFWEDIKQHRLSNDINAIDFVGIVSSILSYHNGDVVRKFEIDISVISSEKHCDINHCLSKLCESGVKELSIVDSAATNTYTIPSCVFNAFGLTKLSISVCIIKTNETSYTGFKRLQCLTLEGIRLDPWVLKIPRLTYLKLSCCLGVSGFSITAPKLITLVYYCNDDINLTPYLICTNITYAYMWVKNSVTDRGHIENVNLVKMHSSWPNLAQLMVGGSLFKYLTTGIVVKKYSAVWRLRRFVPFHLDLDVDQTPWILRIIGNAPYLQTLEIWLNRVVSTNDLEILKFLEKPGIMNIRMQRLHTVKIKFFMGSKSELQFVKILLHCSPSLKQLLIEVNKDQTYDQKLAVTEEFVCLQRAYPIPVIIFGPLM